MDIIKNLNKNNNYQYGKPVKLDFAIVYGHIGIKYIGKWKDKNNVFEMYINLVSYETKMYVITALHYGFILRYGKYKLTLLL